MISVFAASAAIASQNPAKILSGNYHPTTKNDLLQVITGSGSGERALPINADALSVALDVVQIWAVMLTISFTLIIFFFLAFCVCTKRENSYDDFENTQGITTVKVCRNGAENGIHIGPPLGSSTLGSPRATDETSEASSRYTHQRELPAIPTNVSRSNRESVLTRPAANEENQGGNVKLIGGVQVIPNAAMKSGGRAAVIKESVAIATDTRTGANKVTTQSAAAAGHSYVMVSHSKKEHAYAKVVHGNAQEPETDTDNYDDPAALVKDTRGIKSDNLQKATNQQSSHSTVQNRSSILGSEPAPEQKSTTPEPSVVIPAAVAISGRTRANEELPYMTPAALQQPMAQAQQNYSGDSHDSGGYTSISVREPLAALKARQQQEAGGQAAVPQPVSKRQESESEGYYMTVSDDSADETYACIDENSRNGNNATYARINLPQGAAAAHIPNAAAQLSPTGQEISPPAPPSVDSLKHVVHSRQASAGSAASTGLSSPNAERRATKSPLPPLPQGDPDLYSTDANAESTQKTTIDSARNPDSRNLEEMYAKVNKKRTGHSRGNSSGAADNECASNNSSRRSSADVGRQMVSPTATKSIAMTTSLIETSSDKSRNLPSDISMSWSAGAASSMQQSSQSKSYSRETTETKSYSRETSDPGYETVKSGEPPYASVGPPENYPSYEVVRHRDASDMESEHGYETLRHKEFEPGYETVKDVPPKSSAVRYTNQRDSANASDYETVSSTDAGYESVPSREKSGYDPGYEELSGVHARTVSECDPNYEQLKFNSTSECGYEAVSKRSEGNYELVNDYDMPDKRNDVSMPLYATVNKKTKSSPVKEQRIVSGDLIGSLEAISTSDETEHVSVVEVADHSVPVITEMIPKFGSDSLPLTEPAVVSGEAYLVTDSPEDVELPPPELEALEAVATAAALNCGLDAPSPPMSQDTANLLASFADLGAAKSLDVDLITGLYSSSADDSIIPTTAEGHVVDSTSPDCDSTVKNLLCGDLGLQIDLLAESLPPPPTSMIDDLSMQVMPPPPPVDDICGNQELFSSTVTNSISGGIPQSNTALSAELAEFMQPSPLNGQLNGHVVDIPPPRDFPSLMEVLPPPQLDAIEASLAATNSVITVTVNPMAQMQDTTPPPVSSLIRAALSSESSGSTANGGSVESVVTVDVKNGIEVSTSSPQPVQPTLPPTGGNAGSEAKDGHEALTPV